MNRPELIFVAGCNAAGKSSFIRTRMSNLEDFEIIMTDVYKGRTKEVFQQALKQGKNIVLETVFNDSSFKDLVDQARNAGYLNSLIVLFLDNPKQSLDRANFRSLNENGLKISSGNVKLNFNESFKNIANYFFYFHQTDFIYTGLTDQNKLIMTFDGSLLTEYKGNDLEFPQKFAQYSRHLERLNLDAYTTIKLNRDWSHSNAKDRRQRPGKRLGL